MSRPQSLESRIEQSLKDAGEAGISIPELRFALDNDADRNLLRRTLKKLVRAGRAVMLDKDVYAAPGTQADIIGRLQFRAGSYVVEDDESTYAISPEHLDDVIAGDVVRITPTGEQSRGRQRAVIVDIVRPAPREVFALIKKSGRYLIANSPSVDEPILVVDERAKAGGGDLIIIGRAARRRRVKAGLPLCPLMAEMVDPRAKRREESQRTEEQEQPERITAKEAYRFVRRGELHVETLLDQLARGMGVDAQFSPEALAIAERTDLPTRLRDDDVDLRDEALVTIDGETAKDFDDAVAAKVTDANDVELLVAIADVSFYVPVDSALDVDAKSRGSSVYLPGRVYPMLPEQLSNHLCSLVPNQDRYCTWVRMRIDPRGDVTWYDLGFGMMRSKARLTYKDVQAHIDGASTIEDPQIQASISALYEAFKRLNKRRVERGMLDFSLPESFIAPTEDGSGVRDIELHPRWESHRLIEECMLVTNETVADYLFSEDWPCIYRSHDEPDPDKLESAFEFAQSIGVTVPRDEGRKTIDQIALLVSKLEGHPAERVANYMILRAMKKASYSVSTYGHFGIGASRYAHFTSPIRRYADLEVHRVLRKALRIESAAPGDVRRLKTRLQEGAQAANAGETRAVSAERFADRLLKARYMYDRVGDVFDVVITGVQNFGLFVSIPDQDIEGLVLIGSLPGRDHYVLTESHGDLEGALTVRRFQLGQNLRVQCVHVRVEEGFINFEIVPDDFVQPPKHERTPADVDPDDPTLDPHYDDRDDYLLRSPAKAPYATTVDARRDLGSAADLSGDDLPELGPDDDLYAIFEDDPDED